MSAGITEDHKEWIGLVFSNVRNPKLNGKLRWRTCLHFVDGTSKQCADLEGFFNYGRFFEQKQGQQPEKCANYGLRFDYSIKDQVKQVTIDFTFERTRLDKEKIEINPNSIP